MLSFKITYHSMGPLKFKPYYILLYCHKWWSFNQWKFRNKLFTIHSGNLKWKFWTTTKNLNIKEVDDLILDRSIGIRQRIFSKYLITIRSFCYYFFFVLSFSTWKHITVYLQLTVKIGTTNTTTGLTCM